MVNSATQEDYENVLGLYESLPVSDRAAERLLDHYFTESKMEEGLDMGKVGNAVGGAKEKALSALTKMYMQKNKPTKLVADVLTALEGMKKAIEQSSYTTVQGTTAEMAQAHAAVIDEYIKQFTALQAQAQAAEKAQEDAQNAAKAAKDANPELGKALATEADKPAETEKPEETETEKPVETEAPAEEKEDADPLNMEDQEESLKDISNGKKRV